MSKAIKAGWVYWVDDTEVRLNGEQHRVNHNSRPVLVVSDLGSMHGKNLDPGWPTVTVIPISSSTSFKTKFDVKLAAGVAGLPKKCWARVPAIQVVEKHVLGAAAGELPANLLYDVAVNVLDYLGVLHLHEPDDHEGVVTPDGLGDLGDPDLV